MDLCNAFHLPIVSFMDTPGVMTGPQSEREGALRAGMTIAHSYAFARVPLLTVALHKGNVYWEMSGWAPKYLPDQLKKDIRSRLKDKIMFGSDYPSMPYERIFREWEEIGYKEEILEGLFHKNAEDFLGL